MSQDPCGPWLTIVCVSASGWTRLAEDHSAQQNLSGLVWVVACSGHGLDKQDPLLAARQVGVAQRPGEPAVPAHLQCDVCGPIDGGQRMVEQRGGGLTIDQGAGPA